MSNNSDYISFFLAHMPKPRPAPPVYVQKFFYPGYEEDYRRRVKIDIEESKKRISAHDAEMAQFRKLLQKHFSFKKRVRTGPLYEFRG